MMAGAPSVESSGTRLPTAFAGSFDELPASSCCIERLGTDQLVCPASTSVGNKTAFVPSLTLERPLFHRERADGCYSALAYYMSKFIEEALLCTVTSLLFSVIVFFAVNLQGNFFVFALIYFLTSMVGIVLAYAVAAVAPTMDAANALLPTYVTTCMYFGGLFIVFDKIPVGWKWYSWTSFLRYAWAALMINQFHDQPSGVSTVFFDDSAGVNINVLQFYGMDDGLMSSLWGCIGLLTAILVCFGVLGALLLTFVSHMKR